MDNDCSVMLTGDLVAGRSPDEVKQALAGLFKISTQEVDSLLSKAPVRIKQTVDQDTAQRYQDCRFMAPSAVVSLLKGQ